MYMYIYISTCLSRFREAAQFNFDYAVVKLSRPVDFERVIFHRYNDRYNDRNNDRYNDRNNDRNNDRYNDRNNVFLEKGSKYFVCDTLYTIYLSICTQTAYPKYSEPFSRHTL